LLAMIAIDTNEVDTALIHAEAARAIYDNLADPWGLVESKLLFAQIALARGDASAHQLVEDAQTIALDEAEPRQHRHLTAAWLANAEERWDDAIVELDGARAAFGSSQRTGDHTPHLLARFGRMAWVEEAARRIEAWLAALDRQNADGTMALSAMTTLPTTDELEKA
jgi:hypothetical protein